LKLVVATLNINEKKNGIMWPKQGYRKSITHRPAQLKIWTPKNKLAHSQTRMQQQRKVVAVTESNQE